jgi:hypothetical protein
VGVGVGVGVGVAGATDSPDRLALVLPTEPVTFSEADFGPTELGVNVTFNVQVFWNEDSVAPQVPPGVIEKLAAPLPENA